MVTFKNSLRRLKNAINMLPTDAQHSSYLLICTDVILLWKVRHQKVNITVESEQTKSTNCTHSASVIQFAFKHTRQFKSDNNFFIRAVRTANELIKLKILNFESTVPIFSRDFKIYGLKTNFF